MDTKKTSLTNAVRRIISDDDAWVETSLDGTEYYIYTHVTSIDGDALKRIGSISSINSINVDGSYLMIAVSAR